MRQLARCSAVLAAIGMLAAFASADTAAAASPTLDRIKSRGSIVFSYRNAAPPFSYKDREGHIKGYSVDLCLRVAAAIQKELGMAELRVDWVSVEAATRFEAVATGKVDADCGTTTISLSRMQTVDFSVPIFVDGGGVLVRATKKPLAMAELKGKRIAVIGGTTTEQALVRALSGGRQLPRDEVYAVIERTGITTDSYRGYHVLWRLAQERVLCFGPHAGKQPTFALLDEWVPACPALARDEALALLARRYFAGHGPATAHDLAWWSGLKVTDVKAAIESLGDELVKERIAERVYVTSAAAPRTKPAAGAVHLLPGFDELLLGYQDRSASLDRAHADRILPGGNGVFMPTIVGRGRVLGTWRASVRKQRVELAPAPFAARATVNRKGLKVAAERYARFLGSPVSLAPATALPRG